MKHTKEIIDYIVEWIKNYATNANINTLVVGVSGGIDSAVVSTLCAMTNLNTILVEMPINQNDKKSGYYHIESLRKKYDNIISEIVDITDSFNSIQTTLSNQTNQPTKNLKLSMANMASRLRMIILYSFSNSHNGLVIGTGNKVEDFGIGFFTRGGDGTVDISPIADLMKSEVFELGEYLGINEDILTAQPTDGLWDDGRTDEDQIGATYDELEWAMDFSERVDLDIHDLTNVGVNSGEFKGLTSRDIQVLQIYKERHNTNLHKMNPIPICEIPKNFYNE